MRNKNKIPESLEECFEFLKQDKKLVSLFKEPIKNIDTIDSLSPISEIPYGIHFGLGMWIRNNWGLWAKHGSLYKYFKSLGIWHSDDMSGIIFTSFRRYLHNQLLDVPGQVKYYKKFWGKNIPEDAFK